MQLFQKNLSDIINEALNEGVWREFQQRHGGQEFKVNDRLARIGKMLNVNFSLFFLNKCNTSKMIRQFS